MTVKSPTGKTKTSAELTPEVDPLLMRQQEITQESQMIIQQLNDLNQQLAQVTAMIENRKTALARAEGGLAELKRLVALEE